MDHERQENIGCDIVDYVGPFAKQRVTPPTGSILYEKRSKHTKDVERGVDQKMPIYFIHQEERGNWLMKIGRAKDMHRRLRQLQTGNPKELKIVGWIVSENDHLSERALHKKYSGANVGGEWFNLQPADILEDLQAAGINGFVAKNADAFEVTGYDRDAVPEYMGVWDWGDLEIEDCCPFCGCMCGMAFQDASQMYHCRSCDELTDFSENSPDFDNEEDYLAWKAMRDARKAEIKVNPPKRRALE